MNNTAQSRHSWRIVVASVVLLLVTIGSQRGLLCARDQTPAATEATPAQTAIVFLKHLEKGEVGPAIQLWDAASASDKLKTRLEKISSKLIKAGGIKKIDVGQCEARRIKRFEQKLGGKIDVVPLEIICGNDSLILAVFSFRKTDDGYGIFLLESLKEWGGTASLDDELRYSH